MPSVADLIEQRRNLPIIENADSALRDARCILEFLSTLDILKSPPEGYLYESVDLVAELEEMQQNLHVTYSNQYDFETNLTALSLRAHEGHFFWGLSIPRQLTYKRTAPALQSISIDGQARPLLYTHGELFDP